MKSAKSRNFVFVVVASASFWGCSKGGEVSFRHGINIEDEKDSWSGSVPITGGWLNYENARVRCSLQSVDARQYKVNCQALAEQENGNEIIPRGLAKGLRLSWFNPEISNNNLVEDFECIASKDQISNQCFFNTKSDSDIKIKLQMRITSESQSRRESATVLIPYSVELTAGLVPSMRQTSENQGFGLENSIIPATSTEISSDSVCASSYGIFVSRANHVFRIPYGANGEALDKLQHVMGSHAEREVCSLNSAASRCRPVDIVLGNKINLSCSEKGLYVSDVQYSRLLFIPFATDDDNGNNFVKLVSSISDNKCVIDPVEATLSEEDDNFTLTEPSSPVIEDMDGSIILADTCRHVIVRIDASGARSTIGGTGVAVRSQSIEIGREAIQTDIYKPHAIGLLSSGDIVFGHWDGSIYKISAVTRQISLVAKINLNYTRRADFDYPLALTVDRNLDTIYVSDIQNHRIYKVLRTGEVLPFAGSPIDNLHGAFVQNVTFAKDFKFFNPTGLALDPKMNLLVSDYYNRHIYNLTGEGPAMKVNIIAGKFRLSGIDKVPAGLAKLRSVFGMAYSPSGELHFSTTHEHRVKKISGEGKDAKVEIVAGNPDYFASFVEKAATYNESLTLNAPLEHKFSDPQGITFDNSGNLYIADRKSGDYWGVDPVSRGRIKRIEDNKVKVVRMASLGEPTHIAVSASDVFALSSLRKSVFKVGLVSPVRSIPISDLQDPRGMIHDNAKNILYVSDGTSGRLFSIDESNVALDILEPSRLTEDSVRISLPGEVSVTSDGTIFVVDHEPGNNSIKKIRKTNEGLYQVTDLFGDKMANDCSVGLAGGEARRVDIDEGIRMSLSGLCRGNIMSIASKDNCSADGADGVITLSFAQKFHVNYASGSTMSGIHEYGSHIVTIKRPCHHK